MNFKKNLEEDNIIFHLTSSLMSEEAQDKSKPTPESYFWLGIYSLSNKWKFVDGTENTLRNWDNSISDGDHGAIVLGKHQESVIFHFIR